MPRRLFRRRGIALMLALGALLLLPAVRAGASVVVPATLSELAAGADAIARGRIVQIEARQTGSLRVERLITFEPIEYLKGRLGGSVQFRLPGGTFGRYRTVAVGTPEFREGDEVVLFLGLREGDLPILLGFHQGIYRIVIDEQTRQRVVTPPVLQGMADGQPASVTRGDAARRTLPWAQFQAQIQAAVAAGAAASPLLPAAAGARAGAAGPAADPSRAAASSSASASTPAPAPSSATATATATSTASEGTPRPAQRRKP